MHDVKSVAVQSGESRALRSVLPLLLRNSDAEGYALQCFVPLLFIHVGLVILMNSQAPFPNTYFPPFQIVKHQYVKYHHTGIL